MRLVSFCDKRGGVLVGDEILDIAAAVRSVSMLHSIPTTVLGIIATEGRAVGTLRPVVQSLAEDQAFRARLRLAGALVPKSSAVLGAPLPEPGHILAAGMNYTDHLKEMNAPRPAYPYSFVKASSAVIGDGESILLPPDHPSMVDWEAELAVVIGKPCHRASVEEALSFVAGYTCANDVSARDWVDQVFAQPGTLEPINRWALNLLGKQYPTFCPLGPVLLTADEVPDPDTLDISCRVNGTVMQQSNTGNMVFSAAQLISYLSQFYLLMPGDVILTGTMGGVGFGRKPQIFLKAGDLVEVEISEIGVLRNHVCAPAL